MDEKANLRSVLIWNQYDGTDESLPTPHAKVLVVLKGSREVIDTSLVRDHSDLHWKSYNSGRHEVTEGDLWASWPTPPFTIVDTSTSEVLFTNDESEKRSR